MHRHNDARVQLTDHFGDAGNVGYVRSTHRRQQYVDITQFLPAGADRNLPQLSQMADREAGEVQKKSDAACPVSGCRHAGHEYLFDFVVTGTSQDLRLAADAVCAFCEGR